MKKSIRCTNNNRKTTLGNRHTYIHSHTFYSTIYNKTNRQYTVRVSVDQRWDVGKWEKSNCVSSGWFSVVDVDVVVLFIHFFCIHLSICLSLSLSILYFTFAYLFCHLTISLFSLSFDRYIFPKHDHQNWNRVNGDGWQCGWQGKLGVWEYEKIYKMHYYSNNAVLAYLIVLKLRVAFQQNRNDGYLSLSVCLSMCIFFSFFLFRFVTLPHFPLNQPHSLTFSLTLLPSELCMEYASILTKLRFCWQPL